MKSFLKLHESDTVAVALQALNAGACMEGVLLTADIPAGHKFALQPIAAGEKVIKYGFTIGIASSDIPAGAWVHTHNLTTSLTENTALHFPENTPAAPKPAAKEALPFSGYLRKDGRVGIRNEIWILPTVGCANRSATLLAAEANRRFPLPDGFHCFTHPYGCSQLGDDLKNTASCLAALAKHPNAGGVLLVSLGCENNTREIMEQHLGDYDKERIRFLCTQESADETEDGLALLGELAALLQNDVRTPQPLSKLTVGFKCGGSDGFSGITANPLCGKICDRLTAENAKMLLTEVPEMFGAEQNLLTRAVSREVFDKGIAMIESFKHYFLSHGQTVYENPSPGNKEGGITTLEEKSLGCVTKGGSSPVTDVLGLYEQAKTPGLSLVWGPGNDIVSTTALTAAGAVMILFTTGRGTPLGAPVPTVKLSTNTPLSLHKPHWIDFDAGTLLTQESFDTLTASLLERLLSYANGEKTKNEENDYREIAIFKDGVTL